MTVVTPGRVQSIIDFALHLKKALQQCRIGLPEPIPDVLPYTSVLPLISTDLSKSHKTLLRELGVSIWNSCNIISAADSLPQQAPLARLRAFAYLLLASSTPPNLKRGVTTNKLFQHTLTAARECLQADLPDLGQQILENEIITRTYLDDENDADGDTQEQKSYVAECYCLRLLLAWKRGRKDLADHWYSKAAGCVSSFEDTHIEKAVDLLHELGSDCLARNDIPGAVKWLGRAMMMLDQEELSTSFTKSDLKLTVLHYYVQALSKSSSQGARAQAESIIEQLSAEYGPRLPILLLSLELLCEQDNADSTVVASRLREVISTAHLLESNHRLILHFIHCLHVKDTNLAIQCLKLYIVDRLMKDGTEDWVEMAIISHLSLFCGNKEGNTTTIVKSLEQDLDLYLSNLVSSISASAAQAAHVLIWKMIHETDSSGQRSLAMSWCQLGLHAIFELAGEINTGKLGRQLISYHLLVSNLGIAHRMLEEMSFIQQNNGNSRYLAYCVAIRSGNDGEAQSCLNTITNGQGESDQILFACAGESIKYGKPLDTARLLQRIFDKHYQSSYPPVDLGALLQHTAKTLMQVTDEAGAGKHVDEEIFLRFCTVFKHAVKLHNFDHHSHSNTRKNRIDTQWFEVQAFEAAKAHLKSWPKRYLIDILQYSSQLGCSDESILSETAFVDEMSLKLKYNKFMQAVLYATEAREFGPNHTVEDLPRTSYDAKDEPKTSDCRFILHTNVFNIFSALHKQYNTDNICTKDEDLRDARDQLRLLVPLAFEALLFIKANEYLSTEQLKFDQASILGFLTTANELEIAAATYALLADTVLAFASGDAMACPQLNGLQIPSISAARLLGRIIQALREVQAFNIDQAARWIRCVVQLIIEGFEKSIAIQKLESEDPRKHNSDHGLHMLNTVIEQAIDLAKSSFQESIHDVDVEMTGVEKPPKEAYPDEELEWLATKLFNMAIDFYSIGQEKTARLWAMKAVELAELLQSGIDPSFSGQDIAAVLREKVNELEWKE